MAVSYKPLMHMMIERDISNAELCAVPAYPQT